MFVTLSTDEVRKALMEAIESKTKNVHGTVGDENFYITVKTPDGEVEDFEIIEATAIFHE
jgi:hypothetical protein